MPRSTKKSITVPMPIRDGLARQIHDKTLDYPSENAAWIGLARYQLLVGQPHPVTTAIARMHPEDQDVIDDFLLEVARSGITLRGQFLMRLIQQAIAGSHRPNEQEVATLVPAELLKTAKQWQRGELKVADLKPAKS